MAAEHAELVGEMMSLEKMQMSERLKHAKKRRAQQLKVYFQYEKQLEKENGKKGKKSNSYMKSSQPTNKHRQHLQFDHSILILDATARNDVEEVRNLLNAGISPDVCNEDGLTALHQCSIDNLEEVMKLLIEFRADISRRDSELWTPLHAAATCGHTRICRYLCDHGADLLAVNADGNMPYDLCEDVATLDYIESEMARKGVTQELIDDTRLSAENQMLSDLQKKSNEGGNLECRGKHGETPLHIAACNGYIYVTEFLLSRNVSINVKDKDEWQPMHCAACWGQLAIIEMLLEHGADYLTKTKNGETALDLCEDIEMKQRVLATIEEIESKKPHKPRETISTPRRNSTARRGSTVTNLAMRRSSVHEKISFAQKEAQLEAMRLKDVVAFQEDEDDEDETVIEAVTVAMDEVRINVAASIETKQEKPLKPIIVMRSKTEIRANGRKEVSDDRLPHQDEIWMTSSSRDDDNTNGTSVLHSTHEPNQKTHAAPSTQKTSTHKLQSVSEGNGDVNLVDHPSGKNDWRMVDGTATSAEMSHSKTFGGGGQSSQSSTSFSPNGSSMATAPSGTLLELKRQRAKRMTEAMAVATTTDRPNGSCSSDSKNGNSSSSGTMTIEDVYGTGDGPRRKYVGRQEMVNGDSKKLGCCTVM